MNDLETKFNTADTPETERAALLEQTAEEILTENLEALLELAK